MAYRHRNNRWQARVTVNGITKKKNFRTKKAAEDWEDTVRPQLKAQPHAPLLGGPAKCTLAELLFDYAKRFTILKKGYEQELTRINRYLAAANLPCLKAVAAKNDKGQSTVQLMTRDAPADTELPSTFEQTRRQRVAQRTATNTWRAQVANKKVKDLSPEDLTTYKALAKAEGLAESTVQKELALLKVCLNEAIHSGSWVGYSSPFTHVKVPKGIKKRDFVLNRDKESAIVAALQDCRNDLILPLFDFAIESTQRISSLLLLEWDHIDLDERYAMCYDTKTNENVKVPLTQKALRILHALKATSTTARVFPTTYNAVHLAWKRACERAGVSNYVFHDNRHVGITRHMKRLRSTELVKKISGHKTDAMLAHYTHLMNEDVLDLLDATEPGLAPTPPTASLDDLLAALKTRVSADDLPAILAQLVRAPEAAPAPAAAQTEPADGNVIMLDFTQRRTA